MKISKSSIQDMEVPQKLKVCEESDHESEAGKEGLGEHHHHCWTSPEAVLREQGTFSCEPFGHQKIKSKLMVT